MKSRPKAAQKRLKAPISKLRWRATSGSPQVNVSSRGRYQCYPLSEWQATRGFCAPNKPVPEQAVLASPFRSELGVRLQPLTRRISTNHTFGVGCE